MKKESPPRDLQSRYRSELIERDRLKDQLRQVQSTIEKIKAVPEIASYLASLARWRAPKPPAPLGQPPVIYYEPTPPSAESAVGKGLREIKTLDDRRMKTDSLIRRSREKLAQMEVEAIAQGVELPPRQTSDGVHTQSAQPARQELAIRSDPGYEFRLAEAQKAIERSARARRNEALRRSREGRQSSPLESTRSRLQSFSEAGLKAAKTGDSSSHSTQENLCGIPRLEVFKKSGDKWRVTYAGKSAYFSNILGFHYLEFLLGRPGESIPVSVIEQFKHGLPASDERNTLSDMSHEQLADEESMTLTSNLEFARRDLGEMTDKKSLAKYRAELKEIEAELDRLPPDSPERPMVEADKEKLLQHLNSVLKLGGEIRTFDGPKEQARKNVSRAIKLAIKKIQREFPVLAACLDSAVKRGTECCYNPPNLPS